MNSRCAAVTDGKHQWREDTRIADAKLRRQCTACGLVQYSDSPIDGWEDDGSPSPGSDHRHVWQTLRSEREQIGIGAGPDGVRIRELRECISCEMRSEIVADGTGRLLTDRVMSPPMRSVTFPTVSGNPKKENDNPFAAFGAAGYEAARAARETNKLRDALTAKEDGPALGRQEVAMFAEACVRLAEAGRISYDKAMEMIAASQEEPESTVAELVGKAARGQLDSRDAMTLIVQEVKHADDPLAAGGEWITLLTMEISEATREAREREEES